MENVKSVLLSNFPLPYDGIASWTTRFNYNLLNNSNFDYVICPYSNKKVVKPKQFFINTISYIDKVKNKFDNVSRFNNYTKQLTKLFKLHDKLVIQVIDNVGLMFALIAFVKSNNLRKRVYLQFSYHGFSPFPKAEVLCSNIDELILLSTKSYHAFKNTLNILPIKVSVLNNGVDSSKFKVLSKNDKRALKINLGFKTDTIYFVWCSQDRQKKGLDIILQVWDKLLVLSKYNIELLVVGIEKKISNQKVTVIGKVPNAQLNKYLQVSDFYLFSTLCQEGFGLSLLEAMKSGAYCIASNMGAVSEVLNDGKYGKLINTPHSVDYWVKEISISIDEYILNDFQNKYSNEIPNDYCDIKKWNDGLNAIIKEAKVNFSNRYYL